MSDFSAIDSNFRVETKIDQADLRFYDPQQAPFQICGVFFENGKMKIGKEFIIPELMEK